MLAAAAVVSAPAAAEQGAWLPGAAQSAVGIALALATAGLAAALVFACRSQGRYRAAARASREQAQRLADVIEGAGVGTWEWDVPGDSVALDARCCSLLGYEAAQLSPLSLEAFNDRLHPDDRSTVSLLISRHLTGELPHYECEYRVLHRQGFWVWVRARGRIVRRGNTGAALCVAGVLRDVTAEREASQHQYRVANYDSLTGLPNRSFLQDLLAQDMRQCDRNGTELAIVHADLDDFEQINVALGHEGADRLLLTLAERLLDSLRGSDTVARVGGDELVCVLTLSGAPDERGAALQRLRDIIARSVEVDGQVLALRSSMGCVMYPQDDPIDAEQLLRQAAHAMFLAKEQGKNRLVQFDSRSHSSIRQRHAERDALFEALDRGEVALYYQPKVEMATGRVLGAEALIRWEHPERGLLMPGAFLGLVESSEHAKRLGEWVLTEALGQLEAWRGRDLTVSVNIDGAHLQRSDFVPRLEALLDGVDAGIRQRLQLEVLESSVLGDLGQTGDVVAACRALGPRVALDDFGVGFSTLAYLRHLQADELKVDRSFVKDLLTSPDDAAIIRGILGLASAFGCGVVAEGVEEEAHGAALIALGCRVGQGFAIARAMPASQFPGWCDAWQPPASWQNA